MPLLGGFAVVAGACGTSALRLTRAEYVRDLAAFCKKHDALLIFDEVQAGFGRTGKFWAFEHYGVVPDVICCGKGISSSLPLSCVLFS